MDGASKLEINEHIHFSTENSLSQHISSLVVLWLMYGILLTMNRPKFDGMPRGQQLYEAVV